MTELFAWLPLKGVTPNQLFVLYARSKGIDYGDYLDVRTDILVLKDLGYLTTTHPTQPTESGKDLLDNAAAFFKARKAPAHADWSVQIETYRQLFPAGKNGSVPYRTSARELLPRFEWFFKTFPEHSWETVLAATRSYIEQGNRTYLRTAGNFIKKQDADRSWRSDLGACCDSASEQAQPHTAHPYQSSSELYKVF